MRIIFSVPGYKKVVVVPFNIEYGQEIFNANRSIIQPFQCIVALLVEKSAGKTNFFIFQLHRRL